MQLDKTHVAIRPRSFSEIGDLSLMVIRQYPQAILIGLALGALPWLVIDLLLVGWIPLEETLENAYDEETVANRSRYLWLLCSLFFLQSPLMGVLTTYYIGQAVFEQRPPWRSVIGDTLKIAPRLFWSLGVIRGAIPAMILVGLNWGDKFSPGIEAFWLMVVVIWSMAIRGFRPFLPEILILERCPLRTKQSNQITAGRRSGLLHTPISGDLMGRFMLGGVLFALLCLALYASGVWFNNWMLGIQRWSLINSLVLMPLALLLTTGLATVIRFLSYLDSRIRLEGWEVELTLRAEALRQFGEPTAAGLVGNVGGGQQ